MSGSGAPLISVVLATHAGDSLPYLEDAVSSIVDQSHENLELIIVLDGEVSDATANYLAHVEAKDSRVRLLPQPVNRGPAAARNRGFEAARGEYIAVFDADDRSLPNRLERELAHLRESGADLVGSFMEYIDGGGLVIGRKDMPVTHEAIRRASIVFNPINNPTAFAKAEVFREYPYDERFRKGEDYYLWAELLVSGKRLGNVPEYLHQLRTGETFLARRYGWDWFTICLRSQMRVIRTFPVIAWPFLAVMALGASSLRLLPPQWLRPLYGIRNSLRFGPGRDAERDDRRD